jgi:hypothetical protein
MLAVIEYGIPEPVEGADPAASSRPPLGTTVTTFVVECVETGSGRALPGVRVRVAGGGYEDAQTTDAAGRATLSVVGGQAETLRVRTGPTH